MQLFPKSRQAVLGLLYGRPGEAFYLREIADLTGLGVGYVQRELARRAEAGIIDRTRRGRQVYFRADGSCPIYDDLHGIVTKSLGAAQAVRNALEPLRDRIQAAFIYGSATRGEERSDSDIDLMVLGHTSLAEVVETTRNAEQAIRRESNPIGYPPAEFASTITERHHFLAQVLRRDKVMLIGDEHALAALSR